MNASAGGSETLPVSVPRSRFKWYGPENYGKVVFLAIHAAVVAVFFVPVTWPAVALCVGCYYLRIFGITAGFHRYFAHRAFKTSRVFQFCLGFLGCSAVQKGPLWWAANHRRHHKHSDRDDDPHSPVRHGLWWSHIGWVLSTKHDGMDPDEIKDFSKYPELRALEFFHWVPGALMAYGCYLIAGWSGVVWGFIVSTVFLYHGTFLVNSVCHLLGTRRYQTGDQSRNNWWVAILTMGEGWHNNHHHFMSSARLGWKWWEIDVGYYLLKILSIPRVVWDLRVVPPSKLAPA